jgi:hypothetical protein
MLIAENIENESGKHQRGKNCGCVQNSAQALPTLALGIEKYLAIGHK